MTSTLNGRYSRFGLREFAQPPLTAGDQPALPDLAFSQRSAKTSSRRERGSGTTQPSPPAKTAGSRSTAKSTSTWGTASAPKGPGPCWPLPSITRASPAAGGSRPPARPLFAPSPPDRSPPAVVERDLEGVHDATAHPARAAVGVHQNRGCRHRARHSAMLRAVASTGEWNLSCPELDCQRGVQGDSNSSEHLDSDIGSTGLDATQRRLRHAHTSR